MIESIRILLNCKKREEEIVMRIGTKKEVAPSAPKENPADSVAWRIMTDTLSRASLHTDYHILPDGTLMPRWWPMDSECLHGTETVLEEERQTVFAKAREAVENRFDLSLQAWLPGTPKGFVVYNAWTAEDTLLIKDSLRHIGELVGKTGYEMIIKDWGFIVYHSSIAHGRKEELRIISVGVETGKEDEILGELEKKKKYRCNQKPGSREQWATVRALAEAALECAMAKREWEADKVAYNCEGAFVYDLLGGSRYYTPDRIRTVIKGLMCPDGKRFLSVKSIWAPWGAAIYDECYGGCFRARFAVVRPGFTLSFDK